MPDHDHPMKVMLITGADRSGSTLLEMILGSIDRMISMGEITYIWERGFNNNQLCGCGEHFFDCEFWGSVRKHGHFERENFDNNLLMKVHKSISRNRHLPYYLSKSLFPKFQSQVNLYSDYILKIYRGVAATNKCNVLIDSSKNIHGYILAQNPEIELYIVHIVRDARATAFSWTRSKVYEHSKTEKTYMPRLHPAISTLYWIFNNISAELLRLFSKNYMMVKYEELTKQPCEIIQQICTFIDEPNTTIPISNDFMVDLSIQHSISGNPVRFSKGQIKIIADDQWKTALGKRIKFWVNGIAWPLLFRYGYFTKNKI